MAKFTSSADLNIEWASHHFVGVAGTTHRVTDALVEEFEAEVAGRIPGFAWVQQDELTSIVTLPIGQTDVTGLTAALDAKYDKTGGTISGSATVTGTLSAGATTTGALQVNGAVTVTSTAVVQGAATVAGAFRAGAAATIIGAANLSSTFGVVGPATLNSTLAVTGKATFSDRIAWGGTSFPGSPSNNDLFYRTDLDLLFFYNGTRWLSVSLHRQKLGFFNVTAVPATISATTAAYHREFTPDLQGGSDIWLEDWVVTFYVAAGGTALGASHRWNGQLKAGQINTDNTLDNQGGTADIQAGSSATIRRISVAIDALLNNGTVHAWFQSDWTKAGTPGVLQTFEEVTYRVVAT